jgi:hypothetical protein
MSACARSVSRFHGVLRAVGRTKNLATFDLVLLGVKHTDMLLTDKGIHFHLGTEPFTAFDGHNHHAFINGLVLENVEHVRSIKTN